MIPIHIAVISSGRPGAPASMGRFLPDGAFWYVGKGEGDDYATFADGPVTESGGLVASRNRALDDAFAAGLPCLQLSDDLTRLQILLPHGTQDLELSDAIESMSQALDDTLNARLAGVAPTSNPFFGKTVVNDHGFCVGDMILVRPTTLRFDPALRLKEDYDYTAQHLFTYGSVARCDWILATFKHKTNRGGAVQYRTPEVEQEAIAVLRRKWPNAISDNPKRADEILFRWRGLTDEVAVAQLGFDA